MLSEDKEYAEPKEVIGNGEEDKNYNRIKTDSRGCGWGQYSVDGDSVGGDRVGMGTKYFTVSSSSS